jgi:molybdopterin molybdotransferase
LHERVRIEVGRRQNAHEAPGSGEGVLQVYCDNGRAEPVKVYENVRDGHDPEDQPPIRQYLAARTIIHDIVPLERGQDQDILSARQHTKLGSILAEKSLGTPHLSSPEPEPRVRGGSDIFDTGTANCYSCGSQSSPFGQDLTGRTMLKPFLRVMSPGEARAVLTGFDHLEAEEAPLDEACFRVLAEPVKARDDLPSFHRSTMDGFAVRSSDTFGATENSPGLLRVVGEISMGEIHNVKLKRGEAVRISTGGALPAEADAVVMIEQTEELDETTVEICKAVAPFENVVRRGEDFKKGESLISTGHRLLPQDQGLLAAMGRGSVTVYRRPRVSLISSGDEIVPIEQDPPPGCVRDVNRHSLSAMIEEAHGTPIWMGIAPDRLKALASLLSKAIRESDVVVISGGSSMGSRDHVIEAIQGSGDAEILVHGVSVSPGKPLILGRVGKHPVVGLPGHPVSAMVCFEQFVVPLMRRLEGEAHLSPYLHATFRAVLSRNCPSREGRTDFVRVRLQKHGDLIMAVPVPGKSGMISSMVRAHGFVRIAPDCEGCTKVTRLR